MICWKCRKEIPNEKPVRGDECPLCHADLHTCRACDFYESGAHNDCREASAEFVGDKERSNFCDYFRVKKDYPVKPGNDTGVPGNDTGVPGNDMGNDGARVMFGLDPDISGKSKADAARDAFNALFS